MSHLGAVIGSTNYKNEYIREKIEKWIEELKVLSKLAWIEPQTAYACFTTGFKHKPTYYTRKIPDIANQLTLLDEVISTEFIPAITGGITCSSIERKLLSLPTKLGGLGIPIFDDLSIIEFLSRCF